MDNGKIEDSLFCFGMAIAKDLPDYEYETLSAEHVADYQQAPLNVRRGMKVKKTRRPHEWDCEVYSFPQTWGHGSTIFGGMGTTSHVKAQVTVVIHKRSAAVYVGRQLGYVIKNFNTAFMEMVKNHQICDVKDADSLEVKS